MVEGLGRDRRKLRRWQAFALLSLLTMAAFPAAPTVLRAQTEEAEGEVTEGEEVGDAGGEPVPDDAPPAGTPAGDAKAGDGGDAPVEVEEESWLTWLLNASGPFGICIGIESFLLVGLIISNILQLRMPVFVPPGFVEAFEQRLQAKDYQGAYELARKDDSFLARVLAGGLAKLSRGYEEAVTGMEQVSADENMALDHRLSYISIIGTTAPMLGLLGTVQGMVQAFSVIARSTVSPKPSELASGITLALVTTLEGLIVAIPAIIAFALFKNRQARLVLETSMVADGLMSRFASIGKRPAGATATAGAPAAPQA